MRAIIWKNYGPPDGLQLQEIEKPIPKAGEVLIRIHATTVTAGDCEMRSLKLPMFISLPMRMYVGLRHPTRINIIGQELAGEIEAVGAGVTNYKVGDQVFAATGLGRGTYCEYLCLSEKPGEMEGVLGLKPSNLTYEEAAAVPVGGLEALHFLRKGNIQPGEKVLVNGAGGSIGTIGVQLAKHFGAQVTAVDSAAKLNMLRSIGADYVIDYTKEDFTKSSQTYDVIFDVVGKSPYSGSIKSLKDNGRYLIANPQISKMIRGGWTSSRGRVKVVFETAKYQFADLESLKELIEAGVIKPVIDCSYPLEQIAEAHRYVETGQKVGNVIINVSPPLPSS